MSGAGNVLIVWCRECVGPWVVLGICRPMGGVGNVSAHGWCWAHGPIRLLTALKLRIFQGAPVNIYRLTPLPPAPCNFFPALFAVPGVQEWSQRRDLGRGFILAKYGTVASHGNPIHATNYTCSCVFGPQPSTFVNVFLQTIIYGEGFTSPN